MNTTQTAPSEEEDDELSTTPPNPALEPEEEGSGWKMPKPVFRQTSGRLPQGFAKKSTQDEVKENVDDDISTASMEKPASLADVEPQPELGDLESGEFAKPIVSDMPKKKGGAAKVLFTVFGVLLVFILIAAFLAVIYFLFIAQSTNGTF